MRQLPKSPPKTRSLNCKNTKTFTIFNIILDNGGGDGAFHLLEVLIMVCATSIECTTTSLDRLTNHIWNIDLLKGWKPATIQGPILGGFIITSLSIIIFLEVLSRISLRPENGSGLAFAADVNSLSVGTTFGYLWVPFRGSMLTGVTVILISQQS